jgi:hypothetical protein
MLERVVPSENENEVIRETPKLGQLNSDNLTLAPRLRHQHKYFPTLAHHQLDYIRQVEFLSYFHRLCRPAQAR